MGDVGRAVYTAAFLSSGTRMTRCLILIIALFAVGPLSGCGTKGELYLPEPASDNPADASG